MTPGPQRPGAAAAPDGVAVVPAPWSLRGRGWIVLLRLPRTDPARHAFLPDELRASLVAPVSTLMCVDYLDAPCGAYRELLLLPGSARFPDGRRHATISRILVSTWASVVSGRANWGIPKDRADFEMHAMRDRERVTVRDDVSEIAHLEFDAPRGPRLPLATGWLPQSWTTLAQLRDGRAYYYRPTARGSARPCRLLQWRCDAARFPDLASATVLASFAIENFTMEFPIARIEPCTGPGRTAV